MKTFLSELEELINRHSYENGSNTPDFILARLMQDCLEAFNRASNDRENWYGKRLMIGNPPPQNGNPNPLPSDVMLREREKTGGG